MTTGTGSDDWPMFPAGMEDALYRHGVFAWFGLPQFGERCGLCLLDSDHVERARRAAAGGYVQCAECGAVYYVTPDPLVHRVRHGILDHIRVTGEILR